MIIDSPIISGSSAASGSLNQFGNVTITGSLTVTGAIIGALTGSVDSASFASTASYVRNAVSASYALTSSVSSIATTASYALTSSVSSTTTSASFASVASSAPLYLPLAGGTMTGDINAAGRTFTYQYLVLGSGTTEGRISTDGGKPIRIFPTSGVESARFLANGNVIIQNGGTYTDNGFRLDVSGSGRFTNGLTVTGSIIASSITSSLLGTASYSNNADLLDGLDSTVFTSTGSFNAFTASINTFTSSATARFVGLETATASFSGRVGGLEAATASLNTYTSSNTANITSLNSYTSSATLRFVGLEAATSSLNTFTSSINSRVTVVESKYATTGSNTFTGCQYISNTTAPTGFSNTTAAVYTDGGLQVTKDSYFSSSLYIKGNLTVYGTQSVSYITSSALNISTNIITVNTATPSVRFGGLAVFDSGSTGLTGSILWDSQNNTWLYSNPTGSGNYDSAMVIMGPRNASALGNEAGLTCNYLVQGHGSHHTTSSMIYHDGSTTCLPGASFTSAGIGCFTSTVCAPTVDSNCARLIGKASASPYANSSWLQAPASSGMFIVNSGITNWIGVKADGSIDSNGIFTHGGTFCTNGAVCAPTFVGTTITSKSGTFTDGNVAVTGCNILIQNNYPNAGLLVGIKAKAYYQNCYTTSILFGDPNSDNVNVITFNTANGDVSPTERLRITSLGVACFQGTVCAPVSVVTGASIVSGCLGVGTGTPRTKAEFSSGLPTSIPTYTNKTNGIVVTDGGDIYGRIGVSDFSAGGNGYPTYIQAGDYSGAIYYNLLLNPLGGNVGIGITAPAKTLHVVSTAEQLRLAYDTSNSVYSDFRNDSAGGLLINTSGGYIINYIGGSAKMRINPDSICFACQICTPQLCSTYVGASCYLEGVLKAGVRGCFVTSVAAIPHIYYGERFPNDASGAFPFNQYGELIFQGGTRAGYNSGFSFATGTADTGGTAAVSVKARIFESGVTCFACTVCAPTAIIAGAVGIGLTSPTQCLEVSGIIKSSGAGNSLMFTNRNCSTATWEWYAQGTPGSGFAGLYKNFNTSGTPLVVTDCGLVGIGTTSPTDQLSIYNGTSNSFATLRLAGSNRGGQINFYNQSYPTAQISVDQSGNVDVLTGVFAGSTVSSKFSIANTGATCFACQVCTPRLHINTPDGCGLTLQYGANSGYAGISTDAANNLIFKAYIGTEYMRIRCDGNVGIGTTSPNETLDVNGTIQVRGTSAGYATTQCVTQLDFYASAARLLSFGGNSTTCGGFRFYSAGQNNNGGSDVATISGGGVACFRGTICTGGHIIPTSNGSQDLGSSSLRWCTVYTSDLSLNNGIGNYTIVEGESDLFLYNNNSCKVFKFLLQEVCPEIAPAKRST